jgi:hypothetical protein
MIPTDQVVGWMVDGANLIIDSEMAVGRRGQPRGRFSAARPWLCSTIRSIQTTTPITRYRELRNLTRQGRERALVGLCLLTLQCETLRALLLANGI